MNCKNNLFQLKNINTENLKNITIEINHWELEIVQLDSSFLLSTSFKIF
jgi:hypothetical protein